MARLFFIFFFIFKANLLRCCREIDPNFVCVASSPFSSRFFYLLRVGDYLEGLLRLSDVDFATLLLLSGTAPPPLPIFSRLQSHYFYHFPLFTSIYARLALEYAAAHGRDAR